MALGIKYKYKYWEVQWASNGKALYAEQQQMSIFNVGAYDIGWMPGAWRCDGFAYPIWDAEHKFY